MIRGRWKRWIRRLAIAGVAVPLLAVIGFAAISYFCPFPIERLDRWPASPRVTDRHGNEMLALVASDQQWRFPVPLSEISPHLVQATIAVEDERFDRHAGIDPVALLRAAWQDVTAGRIVSGGSTLTMQVCRMMDDRPRTLAAKCIETFRSLQLERLRDKRSILETYLNIAPYGRNLRGAEAAARTYFGKPASELSLAEAALLAGLPQSPSRYRPDRYPDRAAARRRTVLRRMAELGMITEAQRRQAAEQPVQLSGKPRRIRAPHAGWLALRRRPGGGQTTIDLRLQEQVEQRAARHARTLPPGTGLGVVVIDIASGDILAMVGAPDPADPVRGQVNSTLARRSPGSTLKPFVYGAAFEARRLAADSIVHDIPIQRAGWEPENFDQTFCGEISAAAALRRSLNIPALLVAEGIGLPRCLGLMEAAGVDLPADALSRGGLGVVTGAVEVRLLDLTNAYATIGRGGAWQAPRLYLDDPAPRRQALASNTCAALDDILSTRRRRPASMASLQESVVPWFMWKTGTSSGRRDAWALGHNGRFAIGIWAGRYTGQGAAGLSGVTAAEPLLAELFDLPAIRTQEAPRAVQPWLVEQPLPPPIELTECLAILAPRPAATFRAIEGRAIIHPRLSRPAEVTWFLNGLRLEAAAASRLSLGPGRYELRCVDATGQACAVSFAVR